MRRHNQFCGVLIAAGIAMIACSAQAADNNFGNPAYTDELAGRKGAVDIVGIQLGMPIGEAIKALKAYDPKIQIAPATGVFALKPDMKVTPLYKASESLTSDGDFDRSSNAERFLILTTTAPSKPYVWAIVRWINYPDRATSPLMANFTKDVIEKYGAPSNGADTNLTFSHRWYIGSNGEHYVPPKLLGCPSDIGILSNDKYTNKRTYSEMIQEGRLAYLAPGNHEAVTRVDNTPACNFDARITINAGSDEQGRLETVTMEAENYKLGWAGLESTRQVLLAEQNAKNEAERRKAGRQAGPKL